MRGVLTSGCVPWGIQIRGRTVTYYEYSSSAKRHYISAGKRLENPTVISNVTRSGLSSNRKDHPTCSIFNLPLVLNNWNYSDSIIDWFQHQYKHAGRVLWVYPVRSIERVHYLDLSRLPVTGVHSDV